MSAALVPGRLAGKRAFVTGGASGIGAAIVQRFREEGAQVVVGDIVGGEVHCDVRSGESVREAIGAAVGRMGGLDTLVCNAGRAVVGKLHEIDEETWDDGIDTNLKGIYLCVREAWPHLVESRGSIVSTASVVGIWGSGNQATYCAAKAGVVMLTKCVALDGAEFGIRANCVCPGFTQTPLLERFMSEQPDPEAARSAAMRMHPISRLGTPTDQANAFVYLASDEASWVTGIAVTVDGGLTVGIWGG